MGDGGLARIRYQLMTDLINQHGKGAYTVVLERKMEHEGDEFIAGMWDKVLEELDDYFKQGEEQ